MEDNTPKEYICRNNGQESGKSKQKQHRFTAGTRIIAMLTLSLLIVSSCVYGIGVMVRAEDDFPLAAAETIIADTNTITSGTLTSESTPMGMTARIINNTKDTVEIEAIEEIEDTEESEGISFQATKAVATKAVAALTEDIIPIRGILNLNMDELVQDRLHEFESIGEDETQYDEEDYLDILSVMGTSETYESSDPKLPSYLKKTYNPDMVRTLTDKEMKALLTLVEAEAPAEDIYGKILVANVVMNRVKSEKMADTVLEVIFEKIGGSPQFTPTSISWYWNSIVVTDSTREAVARCLSGEDYSQGALYFYAWKRHPEKRTGWFEKTVVLFTHGGHRFLTEK